MTTDSAPPETTGVPIGPGIRGWLLVFVLWLGIISPIYSVGLNLFLIHRMEQVYPVDAALFRSWNWDIYIWAITILREAMRMTAAIILCFRRGSSSVSLALAVLWLSGPLLIIGSWAALGGEVGLPGLVRSALVALAWTVYLVLSRRVKATYGFRVGA